jgi:hypothetical protein
MDRHKAELRSVLFPIFVHCYFGLVKYCDPSDSSNQADMPRRFLQRWGPEHQLHYRDEVMSLQSITLAEHLDTHDYAKLLLAVDPVMPSTLLPFFSFNKRLPCRFFEIFRVYAIVVVVVMNMGSVFFFFP